MYKNAYVAYDDNSLSDDNYPSHPVFGEAIDKSIVSRFLWLTVYIYI